MFDPRFPWGARLAAAEIAAREEIDRCLAQVTDRADAADLATRAWTDAIARWGLDLDRLYPKIRQAAFAELGRRGTACREVGNELPLRASRPARGFWKPTSCFRSGSVKEQLFRRLAGQTLDDEQKRRLKGVALAALRGPVAASSARRAASPPASATTTCGRAR